MQKSFSIHTLGCKVNLYESELIAQQLAALNHHRVGEGGEGESSPAMCIVNTCSVTAEAERQGRQLVRRLKRTHPNARVVVTGCYAQLDPQACSALPGVDLVVGNGRKLDIPSLLDAPSGTVVVGDVARDITLPTQPLGGFEGRARAFVQVQQGCDRGCTFCVIHTARGASRSLAPSLVRRQVAQFVANGYGEVVLCGVDLGAYGEDLAEAGDLAALARQLCELPGDFRVRLSSLDPAHLSDELIRVMAEHPAMCPHLHLSLQSANTLILKRMKRRATREVVYERVAALRRALPSVVLSADIMVGFPTESEAHFAETLAAVDELEIAHPHVFAYSMREGTPAARIPAQVPPAERKRRAAEVRERGRAVWRRVAARRVGARLRVLLEERSGLPPRMAAGRTADYFQVLLPTPQGAAAPRPRRARWAEVEITAARRGWLIAEPPS